MKTLHMRKFKLAAATLALAFAWGPVLAEPANFPSPEAAVEAFVTALKADDRAGLLKIFGPESEDLMAAENDKEAAKARREFLAAYDQFNVLNEIGEGRKELEVGRTRWPFPVALVSAEGAWRWDPDSAREEILARRIGENELDVIALLQRAVAVQAAFRQVDYDGDGVMEFASAIISDEGKRNGLYWPPEEGAPESPVAGFAAKASADGISIDGVDQEPEPYLGYFYRILTKQGPSAPGGAYDYLVAGNMVAGHAILAFPAEPGKSGNATFMVGENGVVYEAYLGDDTLEVAGAINTFDPGEGWSQVVLQE